MPASEVVSKFKQQTFRLSSTLETFEDTRRTFVDVYTFKEQNIAFLEDLSFTNPEVLGQGIPVDYLITMYPEILKYGRNLFALKTFLSNLDVLFKNNFFDTARTNRILESCYGNSSVTSVNLVNELFQAYKFVEGEKLLASRDWEKLAEEGMISEHTFMELTTHPNSIVLAKFLGTSCALINSEHVLRTLPMPTKSEHLRTRSTVFQGALTLNTKTWEQILGKTPSNGGEKFRNLFGIKPQTEFFLN